MPLSRKYWEPGRALDITAAQNSFTSRRVSLLPNGPEKFPAIPLLLPHFPASAKRRHRRFALLRSICHPSLSRRTFEACLFIISLRVALWWMTKRSYVSSNVLSTEGVRAYGIVRLWITAPLSKRERR